MQKPEPNKPKRRLYPYGMVALVLVCLTGYIYISINRNAKTRELNQSISGLVSNRGMFGLIDSCIRVLYLAENNSRLYAVTSEKKYFETYKGYITTASNLLDSLYRVDQANQSGMSSLLEEKEERNARFITLRKLADSLLTLSGNLDTRVSPIKIQPGYSVNKTKTTTTLDTAAVNPGGKRKKLLGRIADAFKRTDKEQGRKYTASKTTKVDSTAQVQAANRKELDRINRHYQQYIELNNKLKNTELSLLLVNNLLIDKLQTQLNDFKDRIVNLENIQHKEAKSAMQLAVAQMRAISIWEFLIVLLIIAFLAYNVWRIYHNEGQLQVYSIRAEQNARSKNEFLANMSHEIRTPLNSIIGFSEQLNHTDLSKEQKVQTEAIRSSSNMLLAIVNDILDLSKYETGAGAVDKQPFLPEKLINDILTTLKIQAENKGISLIHDHAIVEKEQYLDGDPIRIKQVFFNIIGNAIKFTKAGSVTVRSEVVPQKDTKALFKVKITDTGIGIAPENLDGIFEKFSQVSNPDAEIQQKGTGLGLSIVKLIIDQYKGNIHVESEKGKGTTFIVELPLELSSIQVPIAGEKTDKQEMGVGLAGKKVLLADDNEMNILLVRTILTKWGMLCDVAMDGTQALEMYRQNEYDMLITDIQMPELNGVELTRKVRSMADTRKANIPILGCTANVLPDENIKYRKAGMTDIILKPFKQQELYVHISRNMPV